MVCGIGARIDIVLRFSVGIIGVWLMRVKAYRPCPGISCKNIDSEVIGEIALSHQSCLHSGNACAVGILGFEGKADFLNEAAGAGKVGGIPIGGNELYVIMIFGHESGKVKVSKELACFDSLFNSRL